MFRTGFLACGLLFLSACVLREETVDVKPDGGVDIHVVFDGDAGDFDAVADPMLDVPGPWAVSEVRRPDGENNEKILRTGDLHAPPGMPLPSNFDPMDTAADPLGAQRLSFPTKLWIEEREDGTIYHFMRVYPSMQRQDFNYADWPLESEEARALTAKAPDELSSDERKHLIRLFVEVERMKMEAKLMRATRKADPAMSQDWLLGMVGALRKEFAAVNIDELAARMKGEDDENAQWILNRAEALKQDVRQSCLASLKNAGAPEKLMLAVSAALDWEERQQEVAEDLADESWKIHVNLPGVLIGHNGTATAGSEVTWEFDSKAFQARDHILMASSRVARAKLDLESARP